jgi:hypothetical protein
MKTVKKPDTTGHVQKYMIPSFCWADESRRPPKLRGAETRRSRAARCLLMSIIWFGLQE